MSIYNIVSDAVNYTQNNDGLKLDAKVNNKITLTDYQFMTAKYFISNNFLKSLLCFYETGKGKTLLALYIMNHIFDIYDNWKIIILCKKSLIETPWKSSIKKFYPKLEERIKMFSFEERNLYLKINSFLNSSARTLIIIDEVHIFISRCVEKEVGDKRILLPIYKKIKDIISKDFTNKLLLLSATPIVNDSEEFIYLFNILNPNFLGNTVRIFERENVFYIDELIKGLSGKVSYVKSAEEASFENSERTDRMVGKHVEFINIIPSDYQKAIYLKIDKKEKAMASRGFRIKRNIACQFVYDGLEVNSEFDYEKWIPSDAEELKKKSMKFYTCCEMIKDCKGKVLIFESFIEYGINILKKYLDFFDISYKTFTGEDQTLRYDSLDKFENILNKDGKQIKAFVISSAAREGISFTYITDMFILSSSWNEASLSQVIGRSIRLDSHKDSNIDKVNIYFLQLKLNEVKTADEEIFEIMMNKFNLFSKLYKILKLSSIEYIQETVESNALIIEPFKNIYYEKINENNKMSKKYKIDKIVEVVYYSYDKSVKRYYVGYREKDDVYDEYGILAGTIIKPEIYKIVDSKLIIIIKIVK